MTDITARLRAAAKTMRSHKAASFEAHDLDAAADEIEKARNVALQALRMIEAVQQYEQPTDPTHENALTMCEHEVFEFDVSAARAALNVKEQD